MSSDGSRRDGWLVRLLVVVGLISGSLAMGASIALAASYPKLAGKTTSGNVFYGSYNGSGSEKWYCGDPSLGGRYIMQPSEGSPSYGSVQTATSWKTRNGSSMSAAEVRRLAWVLSEPADTTSDDKAAKAGWAVRDLVGNGASSATPGGSSYASGGKAILDDAKKYAGPYTVAPTLEKVNTTTLRLRYYRPKSASDAAMEGYSGKLTITSSTGTFEANGGKSLTAPASGNYVDVKVPATFTGSVKVEAAYKDLPATKLYYRNPSSTAYQRVLITGRNQDVDGAVSLRVTGTATPPPAQPALIPVTTQTSKQMARPGESITDRVYVDARTAPAYAGTVTGGLYETGTQNLVGDAVTFAVRGSGWYTSPAVQIPSDAANGARFTWRWNFPAWTNGTITVAAFRTPDNVPSETTTVDSRFTPEIRTLISDQSANPGDEVVDRAWISGVAYAPGIDDDAGGTPALGWKGTVTAALYEMPVDIDTDTPIGTVTYGVDSLDDEHFETTGSGVRQTREDTPYVSDPVTIPADARPGSSYTWVQSVEAWSDDDSGLLQNAVTTPAGLPEETTTLPKATPQYVTQVSDQAAAFGSQITDTVTVSGLWEPEPITIEWRLYGPFAERPTSTSCTDEPFASGTLNVTSNGDHVTDPVVVDEVGYYTYVESHEATDVHEEYATECGVAEETTLVKAQPVLVTQISNQTTSSGAMIHDTITVSGLVDGQDPLTINWELYGPYPTRPEVTDSCEGDVFASGTVTAPGNGDVITGDVELNEPGYYTYVESSEETSAYHPASTQCGLVEETTVVQAQPTYSTVASHQETTVGTEIHDTIKVEGMVDGAELAIEWALYGPYTEKPIAPEEDHEEAGECVGEPIATGTVIATKNGEIDTPSFKVEDEGWYTYREFNPDHGVHNYFATYCGEVAETLLVTTPATPRKPSTPQTPVPPKAPPLIKTGGTLAGVATVIGVTLLGASVFAARRRKTAQDDA